MEALVLDGKSYVKASKAAKELGYATDYVGQLCRSGKVDAHLIGRTWYVNQDMLGEHKVEKKRTSKLKAREYAKKTIEEHRKLREEKSQNIYRNIKIQYEEDGNSLIPETRKLTVKHTPVHNAHDIIASPDEGGNEIMNAGDKVRMSGAVAIVDLNDDVGDTETTVLTPGRIRKTSGPREMVIDSTDGERSVKVAFNTELEDESDESVDKDTEDTSEEEETVDTDGETEENAADVSTEPKISFTDRLKAKETILEEETDTAQAEKIPAKSFLPSRFVEPEKVSPSFRMIFCIIFVCLLGVGGSICLSKQIDVVSGKNLVARETTLFNPKGAITRVVALIDHIKTR